MPVGVYIHKPLSEETKEKLRQANIGKKLTKEHKEKIGLANKGNKYWLGKHHTQETKNKISQKNKGKGAVKGHLVSEETKEKIRISNIRRVQEGRIFWNKGKLSPMKGKHVSEKTREKIRIASTGRRHTEEAKKKISIGRIKRKERLGYLNSPDMRIKQSKALRGKFKGEKSSNWKGGITPISHLIRQSFKYQQWRQQIFLRDDFTCQKCGARGIYLEAHHKKSFKKLIYEVKKYLPLFSLFDGAMSYSPFWDIDNGITLCEKCHNKTKGGHAGG